MAEFRQTSLPFPATAGGVSSLASPVTLPLSGDASMVKRLRAAGSTPGAHHQSAAAKWCSEGEMPTATALLLALKLPRAPITPPLPVPHPHAAANSGAFAPRPFIHGGSDD